MRGTGPVAIDRKALYAYFTTDGPTLRVRVSADDFDRLDLIEGMRVAVELPRQEPAELILVDVSRRPPVVWLELVAMGAVRQRLTG